MRAGFPARWAGAVTMQHLHGAESPVQILREFGMFLDETSPVGAPSLLEVLPESLGDLLDALLFPGPLRRAVRSAFFPLVHEVPHGPATIRDLYFGKRRGGV